MRPWKYLIFERMDYHQFQAQAIVTFEKYSHRFWGYQAIFLEVIAFPHPVSQYWRRSFCQFCELTFTAFSFAARLEKTLLSTFPGLFPLFYRSYQSNLLIRTFQKFILLKLLHALVMRVTSNALWSRPLHMGKYTEYMGKTKLCLWLAASTYF